MNANRELGQNYVRQAREETRLGAKIYISKAAILVSQGLLEIVQQVKLIAIDIFASYTAQKSRIPEDIQAKFLARYDELQCLIQKYLPDPA